MTSEADDEHVGSIIDTIVEIARRRVNWYGYSETFMPYNRLALDDSSTEFGEGDDEEQGENNSLASTEEQASVDEAVPRTGRQPVPEQEEENLVVDGEQINFSTSFF